MAVEDGPAITVACAVTNTGDRAGQEVVQLYIGDLEAQVARPPFELKAFSKVPLEPGATTTVVFRLGARELSYWSTAHRRWILEGGGFEIAVGASSRDLRLRATVDIAAPPLPARLDAMSTLHEWLADPDGSAALRQAIGVHPDGTPRGILGDDELIRIIGGAPLDSLVGFPGLGIEARTVAELAQRFQPPSP